MKIPYYNIFSEMLVVDNIDGLVLNTIKVYGVNKKGSIQESVDFYIRNIIGKMAIYPTGGLYDEFFMLAERVANAKIVNIDATDYLYKTELESGDFVFVMDGANVSIVRVNSDDYWDKTESETGNFTFIMDADKKIKIWKDNEGN